MSLVEAEAFQLGVESGIGAGPGPARREVWRRLRRNPAALAGATLIAAFVAVALLGPVLAPYDPRQADLSHIRPGFVPGPSGRHLLGLDQQGRDELSRLVLGARYSLLVGVASLALGAGAGIVVGAVAAAAGRLADVVLMRLVDVMLAVPGLLFAIAVAALLGRRLTSVTVAIAVVNVPVFARLLRGSMLAERERDYVVATRSLGAGPWRLVTRHVLPNSVAPVVVQATLALGTAIVDAAGLAFLGLGSADPGIPEWGRMLAETQRFLYSAPQLAVFPGLAIVASVLGFNLLGEALREALDPRLRRR